TASTMSTAPTFYSSAARRSIFSRRPLVSATAAETATRSASRMAHRNNAGRVVAKCDLCLAERASEAEEEVEDRHHRRVRVDRLRVGIAPIDLHAGRRHIAFALQVV